MFKFLIAVIVITLNSVNLFAADVPFPDDKLRALTVHVRYDAKRLYDETYHLFATGRDLGAENAYKLLFKGLIFGQTFGFTIDTDKLLNAALKKLISKKEFQSSKIFFSEITGIPSLPDLKKKSPNRMAQRNNFKTSFDPALGSLSNEGNIYALFIKGLLAYDEATDSHGNIAESVAGLELAAHHFCLPAHHFCLPALNFCDWLYRSRGSGIKIHKMKLDNITQNDPAYNPAYFEPFLYIIDLIKNPFEVAYHIDFENSSSCPNFIGGSKVYPSGLPAIDVLDKIKKSIMLTIDDSAKEHYERVSEKLTTSAGETRRSQPARKKYERAALVLIGTAGTVGGAFSSHLSTAGSIITTTASISLTLYGAYKLLSVSPVCYGDQSHIDDQIELLSLYLALKENQNFVRDTETVLDVFKLGMDDHWCNKLDRFIRRDQLTLSQMVLKKAG